MATYLERVQNAQKGINSFYNLLKMYKISRLNGGWIGTENDTTNVNLSKFNTYLEDSQFVTMNKGVTASLFDIPMNSKGYDKDGNYGAGAPSDIGFNRNIKFGNGFESHTPLYNVTAKTSSRGYASMNADTNIGGIVDFSISEKRIIVYPNGSSEGIEVGPVNNVYWKNTDKFIIESIDNANHLHMLYCFVSADMTKEGLVLYVTPNFINWNIHRIIPDNITDAEWEALTGYTTKVYDVTDTNAAILQNILKKYFRVLPNNNYLVMYPVEMYRGTDKSTMVKMYSPWREDSLLTVKDPYNSVEDYQDKALKGFSSYLTDNGEVILYYNNRYEIPMILYNGRVMGTYISNLYTNYNKEIIESPKVAKIYDAPINANTTYELTINNMSMDCAIHTLDSKNGDLSNVNIPAAAINLSLGDVGKTINNSDTYDQVGLYIDKSINMMNNIDIDFSEYINTKNINGEDFRNGNNNNAITSWTEVSNGITTRNWESICYGNGKFVVTANRSAIFAVSEDGINWTEVTVSNTARNWYSICYGNGKFVATANNTNIFAVSEDGINWAEITVSETAIQWRDICYGGDKFIVVARDSNVFAYSEDGTTWYQTIVSGTKRNWFSTAYGNGVFVAVAYNSNVFAYSVDGITWTESTISDTNRYWKSICYGNGKFIIISGEVYSSNIFAYSEDGIRWIEGTISDVNRGWYDVVFSNGMFIAVANNSNVYAYSYDGIHWTEESMGDIVRKWYGIAYGNKKYVAIANNSNVFAYIDDIRFTMQATIVNNDTLLVNTFNGFYRENVRYRATIIGNTLYNDTNIKMNNNPSLGDIY